MIVRSAFVAEFRFEYIQHPRFTSIGIAGLVSCHTPGNIDSDQPYPLLCDQADSGNTPIVMFIGVCETNYTIQAHKADLLPKENSEMMNDYISPVILEIL